MIYLDSNADSPPSEAALDAYIDTARASLSLAEVAAQADSDLASICAAIGGRSGRCIPTRGGTLADARALEWALRSPGHVVTSSIEHAAVSETLNVLEAQGRCSVSRVAVGRDGCVDVDRVQAELRADTVLVSIIAASNETGVVQPLGALAEVAQSVGARFHTDAVQLLGRVPVDVARSGIDLASFSSHKFGGVSGTGFVYVRDPTWLKDEIPPQSTDELDLPGLRSTRVAIESLEVLSPQLRDDFEREISGLDDIEIVGGGSARLPNTSLIRFGGCEGDGLMMALDVEGIATSTGSACASGSIEPSPILLAMGYSPVEARQAVRFSFGPDTTHEEVSAAAAAVCRAVARMREI